MATLLHDLTHAFRSLRAAPLTTAAAILVIALGTGANVAVFAVTYGVLILPLPYPDGGRLAIVSVAASEGSDFGMPFAEVDAWRKRLRTVEGVAGYATGELPLRGAGEPRLLHTAFVTPAFFDVLGVAPTRGQVSSFRDSTAAAAVSGELFSRFEHAAGRDLLDARATVGDGARTVTAVMPPDFAFPSHEVDAWVPATEAVVGNRLMRLVVRVRPGVSTEQLRDDAVRVLREIRGPKYATPGSAYPTVTPLTEVLTGGTRPVLGAAAGAALLVLLVTCGNVAMLLVGRAVLRRRDAAVRLALGAGRWRLARAALVESLLLAAAGSLAGLALAHAGLKVFTRLAAGTIPRAHAVTLDAPALAACAALVVVVTLTCGVAPALAAAREDLVAAFRGGHAEEPRARRFLGAVVVGQIAVAVVLLTGAALLARTVTRLLDEDAGIEPSRALTVELRLGDGDRAAFVATALERVRSLPGVEAAGVGSGLPPTALPFQIFIRRITETANESVRMSAVFATPGFLEALGTPLVAGRPIDDADRERAVAVLSESAARFYAADRDLVDGDLPYPLPPIVPFEGPPRVAGVVRDVKYDGLDAPAAAAVYVPWSARPQDVGYLVVRAAGDPSALAPAVRRVLRELDPELPIPPIRSLEDEMALSVVDRRLRVVPALGFAAVALAVALTGLFALLARAAAERRRELAIRMALGASRSGIMGRTIRGAAVLTALGIAAGLAGAAVVTSGLRGLLYGVAPHDPPTLAAVVALVAAASLVAAYVPARRAARVEPWELLREE